MPTDRIADFRQSVNEYYRTQKLLDQELLLLPKADAIASFGDVTEELIEQLATLEPLGNANPQPVLQSEAVLVVGQRRMGADSQHLKLELQDDSGKLQLLAFNAQQYFFAEIGERVSVWYSPDINEWNGRRTVEGRLLHIERAVR
jgi:single-stranded-DNA-specific exonuclease